MCGIAGIIDLAGPVDDAVVERMCSVLEHRGPDAHGLHSEPGVALGVRRLAIIDVATGDQPIANEDGSVVVVLNGEIYNYRELREELLARGHRFATRSDTEVLVHLYEEHGRHLVERLRGMFAFAIWDRRRRELVLARDRVGKKPLYVARRGSRISFASEVRALLEDPELDRRPDLRAIDAYLGLQYVPDPLSAFSGVEKLAPASTLTFSERGADFESYWALDYSRKLDWSVPELEERLRELIREATRIRLMSEVPLGAFLSGGIDSSAVVAAMAEQVSGPVKTFSIGFSDEAFDEVRYARLVADRFATDHHEFVVEPHALEMMPRLARQYGEPFADPSAIPSFALAELTSAHVTVALNGDGGDESFAGYRRYVGNDMARRLNWLPRPLQLLAPRVTGMLGEGPHVNSTRTRLHRLARSLAMRPAERYAMWMCAFDARSRRELETPEFREGLADDAAEDTLLRPWADARADGRVDRMLAVDVSTYLPGDLLVKMDIATMAHSVEARSPFLDHELMEFAAAVPEPLKLNGGSGKRLLKSALRGWLPDEILDRGKMGFGVPLSRWFREDLRDLPKEVLLDQRTLDRGYFSRDRIERLIDDHVAGATDNSLRIWVLLQLEMWHREVLEAPPARPAERPAVSS